MCTISFIARERGYLLAMNRDEKLTRPKGLPPTILSLDDRKVICPSEPSGGTWIALNDAGVTFALINWYSIKAGISKNPVSRGEVVNFVRSQISADGASEILGRLPLKQINPFRLIGVFPLTQEIVEWRWDLEKLDCKRLPWRWQQFISSGFDEQTAQIVRNKNFNLAIRQDTAGTLGWLRRLHRSHTPASGPFSTCMHRDDAATVSYAEVAFNVHRVTMRYKASAPCQSHSWHQKHLERF
jgi:Transport and Golgi organisation 2